MYELDATFKHTYILVHKYWSNCLTWYNPSVRNLITMRNEFLRLDDSEFERAGISRMGIRHLIPTITVENSRK